MTITLRLVFRSGFTIEESFSCEDQETFPLKQSVQYLCTKHNVSTGDFLSDWKDLGLKDGVWTLQRK